MMTEEKITSSEPPGPTPLTCANIARSKITSVDRPCPTGKIAFQTRADAEAVLRLALRTPTWKNPEGGRVYRCICGAFHLTSDGDPPHGSLAHDPTLLDIREQLERERNAGNGP